MRHNTLVWCGEDMTVDYQGNEIIILYKDGTRVRPEIEREIIKLFRLRK